MSLPNLSIVKRTRKSFLYRAIIFLLSKETYSTLYALFIYSKDALVLSFRYKVKKTLYSRLFTINGDNDNIMFSIIMPSYNRRKCISDAIISVLQQSYSNYELIIVDDGSSDGSVEFIKENFDRELKKGRIRLFSLPKNEGVCYARNFGLKRATGDTICYLDSDNKWCSWYLDYIAEHYRSDPACKLAYTSMLSINKEINTYNVVGDIYDFDRMMEANYIDMNVFSHKASLSEKYGDFDTELKRLVDYELIMRFAYHYTPAFLQRIGAKYIYRRGIETITNSEELEYQRSLKLAHKKICNYRKKLDA